MYRPTEHREAQLRFSTPAIHTGAEQVFRRPLRPGCMERLGLGCGSIPPSDVPPSRTGLPRRCDMRKRATTVDDANTRAAVSQGAWRGLWAAGAIVWVVCAPSAVRADAVLDWNAIAQSTTAPSPPPLGARNLAIVQAAVFDAV